MMKNASELDRLKRLPGPLSFANDYSILGASVEINYVKFPRWRIWVFMDAPIYMQVLIVW